MIANARFPVIMIPKKFRERDREFIFNDPPIEKIENNDRVDTVCAKRIEIRQLFLIEMFRCVRSLFPPSVFVTYRGCLALEAIPRRACAMK